MFFLFFEFFNFFLHKPVDIYENLNPHKEQGMGTHDRDGEGDGGQIFKLGRGAGTCPYLHGYPIPSLFEQKIKVKLNKIK